MSETNTAYLVTNTETGTIAHEIQRALKLPKYGSQSETTRISWIQLGIASGSQA
jgi:hypothetical protein